MVIGAKIVAAMRAVFGRGQRRAVAVETALAEANESLEQRVRDRTQELTLLNAELRRAQAKAETANSDKTRFLAAASHDLLQPLNAARLYTSTLVERSQNRENAELARNIDASLNAVEDILSALLDISKLDAGALPTSIGPIDVGELFEEIEVKFAPLALKKDVALAIVPCHAMISSDRALIGRVLQNLVSNAVKYTPAGGKVLVGARRMDDHLRLDVYDSGIGIPHAKQDEIFREFTRLDKAAKLSPGLGLGLSIVQRILANLDHQLDIHSIEGRGAHFSVRVPLAKGEQVAGRRARIAKISGDPVSGDPVAHAAPELAETERPDFVEPVMMGGKLAGLKVLCVDNERDILTGMGQLLTGWECEVKTALSLRDLVDAGTIDGWLPDIVLMDYHLDQVSGIDAIAWLRQNCGGNLPAVLVTADRSTSVEDQARSNEIMMLHKPVKPAALRAVLARVV